MINLDMRYHSILLPSISVRISEPSGPVCRPMCVLISILKYALGYRWNRTGRAHENDLLGV